MLRCESLVVLLLLTSNRPADTFSLTIFPSLHKSYRSLKSIFSDRRRVDNFPSHSCAHGCISTSIANDYDGTAVNDEENEKYLHDMIAKLEEETILSFTNGNHHCAWKADPYTKTPACPHKAVSNRLFADATAAAAAAAGIPMAASRFLILDAAHAATASALAERGATLRRVFSPNLFPSTVHALRIAGVSAWLGDVRAILLRQPPPPPFLGIYLDACGSVQRYAPSIRRILGAPDATSANAARQPVAPLLIVPDPHARGGGGVLGITLDHRDPQEPGRDGMATLFATVAAAAADGGLVLECLTVGPAAASAPGAVHASAPDSAFGVGEARGDDWGGVGGERGRQWVLGQCYLGYRCMHRECQLCASETLPGHWRASSSRVPELFCPSALTPCSLAHSWHGSSHVCCCQSC